MHTHTTSFSRCIHLLSPDNDTIYGCIKGNETRGSDRFRLLGLFDVFAYHTPSHTGSECVCVLA